MSSSSAPWTHESMPDLHGKIFVVTGANSGIGLEATIQLAAHGAHVVMGCRSEEKANVAIARIKRQVPDASLEFLPLDLASLKSVRAFSEAFHARHEHLDVLINNAGVMAIPRHTTQDGFEMQLGTNHLGHFALTGLLLDRLLEAPDPRVVTVSSMAHRMGKVRFGDIHSRKSYDKWRAYGQSKLANLLFTYELDHRARKAHLPLRAVACHPGYSDTNLQAVGPQMSGSSLMERVSALGNQVVAQSAYMGALPTLYAATADDVVGGDFIGPDGFMEMRGYPTKVTSNDASQDVLTGRKLWQVSRQLTHVDYEALERAATNDTWDTLNENMSD